MKSAETNLASKTVKKVVKEEAKGPEQSLF